MSRLQEHLPPDHELVARVLQGEQQAFEIIMRASAGLVAHVVYRLISKVEDREDLTQDIYLKVYRQLPRFEFRSRLNTWIGRIAYTTCLNYLKKKKLLLIGAGTYEDGNGDGAGDDGASWLAKNYFEGMGNSENPEKRLLGKEIEFYINDSLEQLQPLQQLLIVLHHQQEMGIQEIAGIVEMPEGTVKSHLFRARKSMKSFLVKKLKKDEL
ncbi:RNA polymerase subunit sigma-24 [Chitinophaga caeni]|uniref:RNA polymerase subunit sigma-24 n=1 Tax=Chitinophaga caeni TaxID=2029983 RepID=A0A291QTE0_9BACT|nr:sigma-70 family RNA polymerase sigma factor [Chitinophaga caeni]ATL47133.1 RNA polymerase subunit sigma-24 [Chitinophaga caeni]